MKYSLLAVGISLAVVANLPADQKINDPLGHWIEKIHDPDPKVRGTAVVELGKLGANAKLAVPAIAFRLETDKVAWVRLAAAGSLGKIGPEAREAVPSLIAALNDTGFDVAHWSASALGKIGPGAKAAVPALRKFLKSNVSSNFITAAVALGQIGPDAKDAIPDLLEAAEKGMHSNYRYEPAYSLWAINQHKQAVPLLMKMLKDTWYHNPGTVAYSLGRIGPDAKEAVPALEHLLRDPGSLVASQAALALWQISKHKNAIPTLIGLLKHESSTERSHAAWRLGAIGPEAKEAIPALEEGLRHDRTYIPHYCLEALEKIDPNRAKKNDCGPVRPSASWPCISAMCARPASFALSVVNI